MSDVVRLYKFYCKCDAIRNLQQRRLKVSLLSELNDPFEFLSFQFPNKKLRVAWENVRNHVWKDKGLICFSKDWKNPLLWGHYADKHRGLALGFDVPMRYAMKVEYLQHRPSFDYHKWTPEEREEAMGRVVRMKYSYWSYETEYRIVISLAECENDDNLWFKKFDDNFKLREVVIGALSEATSAEIRNAAGEPELETNTARLAFRSFDVVKQLNPKKQK